MLSKLKLLCFGDDRFLENFYDAIKMLIIAQFEIASINMSYKKTGRQGFHASYPYDFSFMQSLDNMLSCVLTSLASKRKLSELVC